MGLPEIQGYIYILHNKNTGHHKIGRSHNPRARIRSLQLQTSDVLEVIECYPCEDNALTERWIHYKYKDKRLKRELLKQYMDSGLSGEWYLLDDRDFDDIGKTIESGLYENPWLSSEKLPVEVTNESLNSVVAARLVAARNARGWNQLELEAESGVSQAVISRIEAGSRSLRALTLCKLADALGVSVDYLLGRAES